MAKRAGVTLAEAATFLALVAWLIQPGNPTMARLQANVDEALRIADRQGRSGECQDPVDGNFA